MQNYIDPDIFRPDYLLNRHSPESVTADSTKGVATYIKTISFNDKSDMFPTIYRKALAERKNARCYVQSSLLERKCRSYINTEFGDQ